MRMNKYACRGILYYRNAPTSLAIDELSPVVEWKPMYQVVISPETGVKYVRAKKVWKVKEKILLGNQLMLFVQGLPSIPSDTFKSLSAVGVEFSFSVKIMIAVYGTDLFIGPKNVDTSSNEGVERQLNYVKSLHSKINTSLKTGQKDLTNLRLYLKGIIRDINSHIAAQPNLYGDFLPCKLVSDDFINNLIRFLIIDGDYEGMQIT